MTFQSAQQNWQAPQNFIQQIMQLAMNNKTRPQQQDNANQPIAAPAQTQAPAQDNVQQQNNDPMSQIQSISQLLGYHPNTFFGYNMNNSQSANAPSQNFQQSGGIMGFLGSLLGAKS